MGTPIRISKNCYRGELLTDPNDIHKLALQKRCIYYENWGVKPAAIFLSMQFILIMRLINEKKLHFVIKQPS